MRGKRRKPKRWRSRTEKDGKEEDEEDEDDPSRRGGGGEG